MVATSDQLRHDIEVTRAELSREIDELADRTFPNRIVKRQWPQVQGRVKGFVEGVMGTSDSMDHGGVDSDAGQGISRFQKRAIIVGVAAFGAGMVVASLIVSKSSAKPRGRKRRGRR